MLEDCTADVAMSLLVRVRQTGLEPIKKRLS